MKHIIHYPCAVNESCISYLIGAALRTIDSASLNGTPPADELEIRISSTGGDLHAGFTAYEFFRTFPIPVHMINIGTVESAAIMVYLAGDKRSAMPHSKFKLHDFSWTLDAGTYKHKGLCEYVDSLAFDSLRYADIFKERTQCAEIPFNVSNALNGNASCLNTTEAATAGIMTEITSDVITIDRTAKQWWITIG